MKFLVALSAVAAVASADVVNPALTVPYAYGVHAFGGKSAPCVNAANLPVPCAGAPLAYAGLPRRPLLPPRLLRLRPPRPRPRLQVRPLCERRQPPRALRRRPRRLRLLRTLRPLRQEGG